jgi:general secretion pathway protein F
MSEFSYRAIDATGTLHTGALQSASRAQALESLSRQGLIPLSIVAGRATDAAPLRPRMAGLEYLQYKRRVHVSQRDLLALTQSLGTLLQAGLTIDRALQITVSLAPRSAARRLAEGLLQAVRSGKALSAALTGSGQKLPPYFVSMVAAGEAGGALGESLLRLAELMSRQAQNRERIVSALVYPALLAGVVLLTLIVLLVFVLPRFELLFAESEARLPWSTTVVLGLGRMTADYWWLMLLGVATTASAFVTWLKSARGRFKYDRWLLRTRLTLGLPAALDTARLLRTVGSLCRNGTPLSLALKISSGTVANRYLLEVLHGVTREVQAGDSFSAAFARAGCFPAVAVQLARVGEETGRLDELLQSAAAALEEEAHRTLERLLSLLVPLLTIGMGLVVAGLIGSVLIGLLSINDLAF